MAKTRTKTPKENAPRLDSVAWMAAAFDVLAEGGIDAVRVEPLAKALNITKGSFYWHFADRRALLDAMLQSWMEGRIAAIREQTVHLLALRPENQSQQTKSYPALAHLLPRPATASAI